MRSEHPFQYLRRASWWRSPSFLLDVLVLVAAVIVGRVLYLGVWAYQTPVVDLGSDAGNIVSFVAASAGKDVFAGDEILANPKNYAEYLTLQIPLTRYLSAWTDGDYAAAFLLPVPFLLSLQIIGFYALGVVVLGSRGLAMAFSGMSLCLVELPTLADYWGPKGHGTPREWFQSLLPFVLVAAWKWRTNPRAWAAVLFALGLMVYVHPVSTPGWATAIWLGFLVSRPPERRWTRQFLLLAACTPAFFVAALPFIVNYLTQHEYGVSPVPYEVVYPILKYRYSGGYFDLRLALNEIANAWHSIGIPVAGFLGALVLSLVRVRRSDRRLLGSWMGGVLLIAVAVPLLEHHIAASHNAIPVEIDLIRGLRYLPPLLQLTAFWGAAELLRLVAGNRKWVFAVAATLGLFVMVGSKPTLAPGLIRGYQFARGEPAPQPSSRQTVMALVTELTPPGAKLLANSDADALPLRFAARRPVVYAFKDGGMLGYSNHEALVRWYERNQAVSSIKHLPRARRLKEFVKLGRKYGANFLLYAGRGSAPHASRLGARVVMTKPGYVLLEISE